MRDAQGNLKMFSSDVQKSSGDFTMTGLQKEYSADKPAFFDLSVSIPKFADPETRMMMARMALRKSGDEKAFFTLPMARDEASNSWTMKWYQMMPTGNYEMVFQFMCGYDMPKCQEKYGKTMMEKSSAFTVSASATPEEVLKDSKNPVTR